VNIFVVFFDGCYKLAGLTADCPAKVGGVHVPIGQVPVGADAEFFLDNRWVPVLGVIRGPAGIEAKALESIEREAARSSLND